MTSDRLSSDPEDAARSASAVVELLEVLWGGGRQVDTAPVSVSQLRVMFVLEHAEEINLTTLAEVIGNAPSATSRLCDRLQAVGFLSRRTSPTSRRETVLELTSAGRVYLADLRRRRERQLASVLEHVAPQRRAALVDGLTAFHDAASALMPPERRNLPPLMFTA